MSIEKLEKYLKPDEWRFYGNIVGERDRNLVKMKFNDKVEFKYKGSEMWFRLKPNGGE